MLNRADRQSAISSELEVKFYFSPVKISSQLNRSSMKSRKYILILIIHMYLSIKDPVWCCIPNQMHGLVTWCWRLSPAPAHVTRAAVTSLRNLDPLRRRRCCCIRYQESRHPGPRPRTTGWFGTIFWLNFRPVPHIFWRNQSFGKIFTSAVSVPPLPDVILR